MATHIMGPERETLHGVFSRDLPPALTVDSGDTVVLSTLAAGWSLEPPGGSGEHRRFEDFRPEWRGEGHALCGPIAVRGAEPGSTLEIRIADLRTATWGQTFAGGLYPKEFNQRLGIDDREERLDWRLDPDTLTGRDQHGHTITLRPFMGVMGMPPDEPGLHPTKPPRATGGNIDCKELITGSRLFLPIAVAGGFISVGDGHGLQGDGESSGTAIECPMERADLTFHLHPDLTIATPRAETPEGWLTFGFDEDLDEAMAIALGAMLDLMGEQYELGRREALALASLLVDLRITQVVNGVRGVHAVLSHSARPSLMVGA